MCWNNLQNNNLAYVYIMTADHLIFIRHPKYLIKNLEQRSLKIIGNSNLKLPSADNLIQHKISQFVFCCLRLYSTVFDCLLSNVCTPFKTYLKDHFTLGTQGTMAYQWNYLKWELNLGKRAFIIKEPRFLINYQSNLDRKKLSEHFSVL